jgi:hypothetical protein
MDNGVAIDLSGFIPTDSAELDIKRPGTDKPVGWKLTLAGPSHPQAIAWASNVARKQLDRQARIEADLSNGKRIKPETKDVDAERKDSVEWIASRVIGWEPAVSIGGTKYEYSPENAVAIFIRRDMGWAFAQVLEFLSNETSFMPSSDET